MSETLKQYFTNPNTPKKVLLGWEGNHPLGGLPIYFPVAGEIPTLAPEYKEIMDHPFMRYYLSLFNGKPSFINREDLITNYQGAMVMSHTFTPEITATAQELGFPVADVYFGLNQKDAFQRLVQETIGTAYSTNPTIIEAGTSLSKLIEEVERRVLNENSQLQAVVKIPDVRIAPFGGIGVEFVNSPEEVLPFLEQFPNVLTGQILQTPIMVENYIPHSHSPSITFFY